MQSSIPTCKLTIGLLLLGNASCSSFKNDQTTVWHEFATIAAIFHYSDMLEAKPRSNSKSKLFRRLANFLSRNKSTRVKDSLLPMAQQGHDDPPTAPLYQKLYVPEVAEKREHGQQQNQQHATYPPPEQPQRILNGPIPKNPITNHQPTRLTPAFASLALEAGLAFLTPIESEVLNIMRHSKRCARFRPILSPNTELLLVQPSDLLPFRHVQQSVGDLPDEEKALLEKDLRAYLLRQQRYVLGLLLWNGGIVVTTSTRGMAEMRSKEGFERPSSEEMFGPWKREWDDRPNRRALEGLGFWGL